jgi:cell division septation protein DedD
MTVMKNREFREIQVSSTQLAVIFLGILVIGVVIFLLGVSVGKKHSQAADRANVIAQKAPEGVKERIVSMPLVKPGAESSPEASRKPAQAESSPVKKDIIPKQPATAPKPEPQAAETKAPVKTAAPKAAEKGTLFYVQVGALTERLAAQETAQKFRQMGYPVVVLDPQVTDKQPVFRVRVGGFLTRTQAEEARAKLASAAARKTDYFIVRD